MNLIFSNGFLFQNRQPPKSPDVTITSRLPNKAVLHEPLLFCPYSGLNLNQDKATKPQTVQIVRQGEVTPYWFKFNPLYFARKARNTFQTTLTHGIRMKITTWNVNSLNVRLPQVQNWLADHQPDVLVLQELKLDQDKFPAAALQMMGWHSVWSGQKTYNGVAIISRNQPQDVHIGLPTLPDDPQRRVIAATVNGVRVINVYCVNGEALDSPKFQYKEQWFAALTEFVRDEMTRHEKLVLLGDFNIAPADADCYDPEKWHEKIHCSSIERQWFKNLLDLGLTDSLRQIHPKGAFYTWFDYRGAMFQRKLGLRIDHQLISPALSAVLKDVYVDLDARAQERPSDHAPVVAEFDL